MVKLFVNKYCLIFLKLFELNSILTNLKLYIWL